MILFLLLLLSLPQHGWDQWATDQWGLWSRTERGGDDSALFSHNYALTPGAERERLETRELSEIVSVLL